MNGFVLGLSIWINFVFMSLTFIQVCYFTVTFAFINTIILLSHLLSIFPLHMWVNVFRLLFFHIQVAEVISVNTKSVFRLSSSLFKLFLIATTADNYINKVGSFAVDI